MAGSPPLATPRTAPVPRRGELPENLLTVAEVATVLKVCTATVYRMVKEGQLPAVRIVNAVRVPRTALARLVEPPENHEPVRD